MSFVSEYLQRLNNGLSKIEPKKVEEIALILIRAREQDKHVFVFGNGGSAATASHFACDLGKVTVKNMHDNKEKRVKAIALTNNMAHVTALANDEGYDQVFSQQLRNLLEAGDVALGISASGNSQNVLNALMLAKERGAVTIGFVGMNGGKMKSLCDYLLHFEDDSYQLCEDAHLIFAHLVSSFISQKA